MLLILCSTRLAHAGVLTDGRSWELYVVEAVSPTEIGTEEASEANDFNDTNPPIIRLYGSGRVAIVDKESASTVFGNLHDTGLTNA